MTKKNLVRTLLLFVSTIALSPTIAQARGHHDARHVVRNATHSVHASRGRHYHVRREARSVHRHGSRRVAAGGRPGAWCGWWLSNHLGLNDRNLWLARNWASAGQNAGGPGVGVVVVWRHHVGIITGREGS